ncbi:hypothetical protein BGX26_008434 [Mortierella sp. AD094]|nr:hypothetical protein BGX26_008434 [Mortierella sp. AD094]
MCISTPYTAATTELFNQEGGQHYGQNTISTSLDEVRTALQHYYKPYLAIKRRKQDKEELKEQAVTFNRIPSYEKVPKANLQAPIPLEDLFNKRMMRDGKQGIPKRILIHGRAGVGKTTLCKKLVHAYQSGLWRDRFDAVIWLPLRQLRALQVNNLEDLLRQKYFAVRSDIEKADLTSTLVASAHDGKVLFILDGLDEIITDSQAENGIALEAFLRDLVEKYNAVITSRPSGVDMSPPPKLDLELETVGFSPENVKDYLANVLNPDTAKAVHEFIQQTPLILELFNIPVQLDVVCFSWDSFDLNGKPPVTMTGLYETIVRKLWCKDAVRLRKKSNEEVLTQNQIKALPPHRINKLMATEFEYLGYLAFKGMENYHQIEFDESTLNDTIDELYRHCEDIKQGPLPPQLLDTLKETSFQHTADSDLDNRDLDNRAWCFLHLTFQEYFAATWLSRHLQIKQGSSASGLVLTMTPESTKAFAQQHKYNPRYEIVWWMVAGLLEGEAPETFLHLLQEAPHDLIGVHHQHLLAGCLKELRHRLKYIIIAELEAELMQWLSFDMMLPRDSISIRVQGSSNVYPEELLTETLSQVEISHYHQSVQVYSLRALRGRSHLVPTTIDALLKYFPSADQNTKPFVISALRSQPTLSEAAAVAVIKALKDEGPDLKLSTALALHAQSALPESAISALVHALNDKEPNVRTAVARILGNQSCLPEYAIMALLNASTDGDSHVRSAVALALGALSMISEEIIQALKIRLRDENYYVRRSAVQALVAQSTFSESATQVLVAGLKDGDTKLRRMTVKALGNQPILTDSTVQVLTRALQDMDSDVGGIAIRALRARSTLPESTIKVLISAISDEPLSPSQQA